MAMFISHNDAAAPSTTGKICCLAVSPVRPVCPSARHAVCLLHFASCGGATLNKLQVLCATRGKWQAKIRCSREKQSKTRSRQRKVSHPGLTLLSCCLSPLTSISLPHSLSLSITLQLSFTLLLSPRQFYLTIYNCRDVVAAAVAAVVATSPLSCVVGAAR